MRRTLAVGAASAAIGALVLLALAHTPPVRARVLAWAVGLLESSAGLRLEASSLRYNLLTARVELAEVRLAAVGHDARPLLVADRVAVDLPLTIYLGRVSLGDVLLERGRLEVLTDADGVSNLPAGDPAAPPPPTPRALDITALRLRGLDVVYDNRATDVRVAATGIATDLEHRAIRVFDGITGPFAVAGGIDIQLQERALKVAPIDSRLAFDGHVVSVQDLPIATELGRLAVSGRVTRVLDAPALELTFEGEADVDAATRWAEAPVEASGTARLGGSLVGPADAPEVAVRFDAAALAVAAERDLAASGELLVTTAAVEANRLRLAPADGGEIEASFVLPLTDGTPSGSAHWQNLDARVVMRLAAVDVQPVGTRLDGSARFTGGDAPAVSFRTEAAAIDGAGLTPLSGRVEGAFGPTRWTLTHALSTTGLTSQGTTGGRADTAAPLRSSLEGLVRAEVSRLGDADRALAPLGIRVPEALREAEGAIAADLVLAGTLGDPSARVTVDAPGLDLPAIGASAIHADLDASRARVDVTALSLSAPGIDARGAARIDLETNALSGRLTASVPDVGALQADASETWRAAGAVEAAATLGGTLDAPAIDLEASSPVVTLAGESFEALDVRGRMGLEGIDGISVALRQNADGWLRATGRYGFDRSLDGQVEATGLSWSGELAGGAESRVVFGGRLDVSGSLDEPRGLGRAGFAVTGGVAGDLVGQGTVDLALNGDHARLHALIPSLGAFAGGTIALAAPYDYRGSVVLGRVDLAALAPLAAVTPGTVSGTLVLTAAAFGAVEGDQPPRVEANLQRLSAEVAGVPVALVAPATIAWTPGDLDVREFEATFGSGVITASGAWAGREHTVFAGSYTGEVADVLAASRAFGVETSIVASGAAEARFYATGRPGDVIATLDLTGASVRSGDLAASNLAASLGLTGETLTIHSVSAHVDAVRASGDVTARGRAVLPGFDPMKAAGELTLESAVFDAAGVEVRQTRPSLVTLAEGVVSADDVFWEAAGSTLALGGTVDVSTESPTLDLRLSGIAVLRVLSAFVPTVAIDGTAEVDVRVDGTVAAPSLSGSIDLDNAEVALASPRLVVSELSGPVTFEGTRVELRGLSGSANGGLLVIDGGLVLVGPDIGDGEFYVQAQGVAVEYPDGLRSEIDALLTYDLGEATPILRGDVRVQRSAYSEVISLAALAGGGRTTAVGGAAGASALDDLRLDITVTTVEDLRVDNNYGRFEGGAQLRVVGTAAQPGLSGRATLREGGTIYAAGRTFTLTRGTISFTNLSRIEPDLDIQAETRLSGPGTVTLTLQGTPDRFSFDLASESDASQEEIAMALFGGGVSSENALTLLSSDLLGVAGRQIGLDQLRIDRGDVVRDEFRENSGALLQDDANPVTRLTLSKRLRDDVEFTVSQNLAQNGKATFIVSYFPIPSLELRGTSRDDSSTGLGIRHQVTFGAEGRPRRATARPEVRVAGVRFEGDPSPLSVADLRAAIRIREGDAFDYYDWQRDLDAVTARYLERGYFEARVRGRREERADGRVDVVYAVMPGPLTRVEVQGVQLPRADVAAIEEAWTRAVFDRFVIDDAEARVREHLVSSGFIEGTVEGRMDLADGVKTLTLAVDPGPATGRRVVRFDGARGIGAGDLEAAMARADLAVTGWIDRAALERTLTDLYRAEGYLTARVVVGDPVLEPGRAVLPVQIDEGPRAVIGQVWFDGVADERLAVVEAESRLEPGTPYALRVVNQARQRVDRRYRQLGFNAVEVSAAARPDDAGTLVDVEITITEGVRQVLQDVVTTGASRTREGVVTRALRLPIGEPVNLEQWSLARKRLFDTNVFRSVDIQAVPIGDPVDGDQPVRARVTVEEYPHWRLRYGFQVDRERVEEGVDGRFELSPGAIGEVRNQNLFGRALTAGVATRVERDYQRLNLFGQAPSFFGLPVRSSIFAYASTENIRDDGAVLAVTDVQGVSFEQRWRRQRSLELTYSYRYEFNRTYDPSPPVDSDFPALDQRTRVARLSAALLLDRRDDPVNATRGTFTSVAVEQLANWMGADLGYARLLAQQLAFVRVGPAILATRAVTGYVLGDDLLDNLLFRDRFFAGGGTTVRGYAENGLGPRDIFGAARGGSQMLIANAELRFPLYRWVSGVGFLDAGSAFDEQSPFSWGDLKVGYGAGLRISSPIGLLRLDFGMPGSTLPATSRRGNRLGSGRWYFGIGQIF